MFWVWILLLVGAIVGVSIAAGAMINRSGRRARPDPNDPLTALKASGALKHRKSNRD